jgi:hypothetical protein
MAALAKPAAAFERPGITAAEVEEIREAFKLFDVDESGAWHARARWRGAARRMVAARG